MIDLKPLSKNPLVSIIVPSLNQGSFIRQTLDSILEQDYRPIEILVIDGASTDNTLEVLHKYDNVTEVSWILINSRLSSMALPSNNHICSGIPYHSCLFRACNTTSHYDRNLPHLGSLLKSFPAESFYRHHFHHPSKSDSFPTFHRQGRCIEQFHLFHKELARCCSYNWQWCCFSFYEHVPCRDNFQSTFL